MPAAIEIQGLNKTFDRHTRALKDVGLTIQPGEMVALIGASGSGKSTLLKHVSALHAGDRGAGKGMVRVFGETVQDNGRIAPNVRKLRARIGMIFQQFNLVDRMGLLTNVLTGTLGRIPSWRGYLGLFTTEEKVAALDALSRVGIAHCAAQRASTLSGGQQQRAAIARCLVQRAEIILADEPIASLDPESSRRVMESLARVNQDGITVVVCLHQVEYATRYCARTIAMRDGEVVFDGASEQLTAEFLHSIYGADSEELILGPQQARARREDSETNTIFILASA